MKRKKGKWKEKKVFYNDEVQIEAWQSCRCSVCNRYHTTPYLYYFQTYNFCPTCGADMRKETEDEPDPIPTGVAIVIEEDGTVLKLKGVNIKN